MELKAAAEPTTILEAQLQATADWSLVRELAIAGANAAIAIELAGINEDRRNHPDKPGYVTAREERIAQLRSAKARAETWNPLAEIPKPVRARTKRAPRRK